MKCRSLTRREFLTLVGAGSAAVAVGGHLDPVFGAGNGRRPNIIVILADDQGYAELGCQGVLRPFDGLRAQDGDVVTPNIDSLAKNGVRFTNGYVSCPVCSPTRAGLMTGRYQERFGHEMNPVPPDASSESFGLPLSETTMAARLKAAGYKTALVGKWHLGSHGKYVPLERGFDEFFGFLQGAHGYKQGLGGGGYLHDIVRGKEIVEEEEYLTDAFAREAKSFIDRNAKEPFFLYLALNAVHSPMQSTEKYLKRFPGIEDERRRKFVAMSAAMDDAVGGVLDTLRKNALEEDTLIFYLSDNGGPTPITTSRNDPLHGRKGQVFEGGIRIPYIIQWKGHVPAGKVYDKPVISLDISPTALAAAGAKASDAKFDGVDLMPFLTGESSMFRDFDETKLAKPDEAKIPKHPHDMLYWRYGKQYAIRKGNWKLLKAAGEPELYDLSTDISESKNLAAEKPEKLKELAEQYAKWDTELMKPLW